MLTKQTGLLISSLLLTVPTATYPWLGLTIPATSSGSEHKAGALAFFGGVVALGGYLAWRCKKRTRILDQRNQFLIDNPQYITEEVVAEMAKNGVYCYTPRELGSSYGYPLPLELRGPSDLDDPDASWSDI